VTKFVVDEAIQSYHSLRRRIRSTPVVEFRGHTGIAHRSNVEVQRRDGRSTSMFRGTPTYSIKESNNCRATSRGSDSRPVNHVLYLTASTVVSVERLNKSEKRVPTCGERQTRCCIRSLRFGKIFSCLLEDGRCRRKTPGWPAVSNRDVL
jgi:hypothetical protein